MSDDPEFEAFLKGEDALSRHLQALPAAAPSAALDAAILQRARDLMAQEARPQAANDAGDDLPAPRLGGLGWRWRIPAGIAATVLAGVFANQAYRAGSDMDRAAGMPAADSKVLIVQPEPDLRQAAPAKPVVAENAAPPAAVGLAAPAAPAALPRARSVMRDEARAAAPAPPETESQNMWTAQAPGTPATASAPAPVFAPAPAPIAALEKRSNYSGKRTEAASGEAMQRVDITGSSLKRTNTEGANPVTVITAKPIASAQLEWLANIEALLDDGKEADALDQWRRFRLAHPYYRVPQSLEDRIKSVER